ncbi:hypothetical protein SmJEL517_g00784 [Synchytrium microbalum]|uniref:HORMA domain-containing protein n=1 Tax=Synchytrium microbalum TaxID=1806994 RepID=A0A507CH69_9FUNG|nr:uncharacterized protein SmJEL517_g00784 [Synchytrium microbalum]TPX37005.1 hypothetical protein SmJEL517_g00784 [Synchytrium microbalum]
MSATVQKSQQITLRGSSQIVVEFFDYSINSILYQRGIYPAEDFKQVKRYGLSLFVAADHSIEGYIKQILLQVQKWILAKTICKLVLVISSRDTREVLERWQFNMDVEAESSSDKENASGINATKSHSSKPKSEKEIHAEIQRIMRQIISCVTFLPTLNEPCTFNVLAYTDKDAEVPPEWVDSDAKLITRNAEMVRLRGFSTSVHAVDTLVSYKMEED